MWKTRIFGLLLLVTLFVYVAGCGKRGAEEKSPPASSVPGAPDYSLTAAELGMEFKADQKAADAKYKGKLIEVKGTVYTAGRDKDKRGVILFASEDGKDVLCGCHFADRNIAARVGEGQTVRLKGRCSQQGGPVLTDCEIVDKGPDTRVSITAEQLAKEYAADPDQTKKKFAKKPLLITGVASAVITNKSNYTYAQLKGNETTVIEVHDAGDDEWPAEFKVAARVRIVATLHPLSNKHTPTVCAVLMTDLLDPE